ncbi:MAG: 2-hydroxyacid dehydrogenase [Gammaproteobacteria bacterium]
MQGVFLDRKSLDLGDLDFTKFDGAIEKWQYYDETKPDQVLQRIINADVVVSNKVVLDKKILDQATQLKLICVAATGTNNVDLDAAKHNNIQVCNVRAYGTASVVQHVFVLLLSIVRNIPAYTKAVEQGNWQNSKQFCLMDYPIAELTGKVLGIVGYGELGNAVAKVARAFGMKIKIAQRPGSHDDKQVPLEDLLPQVDVLTLHCPLTPETANLISEHELGLMKPTAILINTARGGIVDELALANALKNGKLAGAGIDVLQIEPPKATNPLLDIKIPNLIVTPHMAWASREARQRIVEQMVKNIHSYQSGNLHNRVV